MILLAVVVLAVTTMPWTRLGSEFMPPLNEGDLLYMPTTPPGISITKARELLQQTDRIIAKHPEVQHVLRQDRARRDRDRPGSPLHDRDHDHPEARNEWPEGNADRRHHPELDAMVQFPGVTNAWTMPIKTRIDMLATGIKTPVGIKLLGDDLEILSDLGEQIEAVVRDGPRHRFSVYSERVVGGNYLDYRDQAGRGGPLRAHRG